MKTNRIPAMLMAATAFAALALVSAANAQLESVGNDGITASPKVRQMLTERSTTAAVTPAAPAMACPMCVDIETTEVNPQAKGGEFLAGTATKVVTRHICTACNTKLTTIGEGKAKQTVATHTCAIDAANDHACCASK